MCLIGKISDDFDSFLKEFHKIWTINNLKYLYNGITDCNYNKFQLNSFNRNIDFKLRNRQQVL